MRPHDLGRLRYNNIRGRRLARGIRFIYGNGLIVVNKNTCLPSWAATPGTIGAVLPTLYGVDLRFRRSAGCP